MDEFYNDHVFMQRLYQLVTTMDVFVIKNLNTMTVPQFTSAIIFFFTKPDLCSDSLRKAILEKMADSMDHFNEIQVSIF